TCSPACKAPSFRCRARAPIVSARRILARRLRSATEAAIATLRLSHRPPRTRAREGTKDPRAAIEERYGSRDRYLALVSSAAADLVKQGYLLEEDIATVVKLADAHWTYVFANEQTNDAKQQTNERTQP